jgi:hypothetical protein
MMLDCRNRADITIVITVAVVAAIVSGIITTGGAIITVGSVVGVPAVVSVVVFVRWPSGQETPCRRVLVGRLVIIFMFQFLIGEELGVLAVGQGLIVLWPGPEVPLLCDPVQRSASLIGGLGVELRGHLPAGLGFSGVGEDEEAMVRDG